MRVALYILLIIFLVVLMQFSLIGKQGNPHGAIKYDCIECHSPEGWQYKKDGQVFDHMKTGFPLVGGHADTDCRSCHENLVFNYIGTNCLDCHTDIHKNELGMNCEDCHTPLNWENRQEILKAHNLTQFPLIGVHAVVECEACHINQQRNEFKNTPVDCIYCHNDAFASTTNPDHIANNFNQNCTECHLPDSWSPSTFNHNKTNFPLTGRHKLILCNDCHAQSYTNLSTDCWSCHETDFSISSNPDHVQNNFNHICDICHNTSAWIPAVYDHNKTQFPLTGAHQLLNCEDCHNQGYTGLTTDCWSCHEADFNATLNPNHITAGFPTNCEVCHNTTQWQQTNWDHDSRYFPIYSGKHRQEWNSCNECHIDPNNYNVFECIFCHAHNNQAQVNNDHNGVTGYVYESQACYNCHPDGEESNLPKVILQKAH